MTDWDKYPYCAARKEGINVHPNEDADSARVFTAPASGWITVTATNATGKIKLEGSGTGQYQGDIEGIAAKALSEAVYVACAYKSNGTVWTSGVLGYSIGSYCSSQASKGTAISNLAMATAVYGYQAKAYFG